LRFEQCMALLLGVAAASASHAAGGHHAVDDAALLEPGRCQIETWHDHGLGTGRSLLHLGPACRVGAVELGVDVNRVRAAGSGTTTVTGAQVKWARAINADWSAGVVFGVAGHDGAPQFLGSALVVPVTWKASETLLAHANIGRDFRHGQSDSRRTGIALEWTALATASFVAERFDEGGASFWRAGARWAITPALDFDISRASGLGHAGSAWWTVGLTWVFSR